jgi:Xaa-Pro aminopeptidase
MSNSVSRAVNGVSGDELKRRWRAVRDEMKRRGIDALVLQSSSDWVGGYIRWFTNQPATNGYPIAAIFPLEGDISLIEQGPFGFVRESTEEETRRTGIARHLTTPSYASVHYTGAYDAELALGELQRLGAMRIGLVAPGAMYHTFGHGLRAWSRGLDIVDATDMVDRIKAVKSAEERRLIRQVAAMQDEVISRVREFIRPGLRDFEIAAYAQYQAQQLGSEQGIYLCSSAAPGEAAAFRPRWMQGRVVQPGDVYSLLVECNGAGGFYAELSRTFVLGRAPAELRDAQAAVIEAQAQALRLLRPGIACRDAFDEHNAYLRSRGLPEERRLSMHGMGCDMVERPLIRNDEDMRLEEDMAIVCHPGFHNERIFAHITDLYLIGKDGPTECLHQTPKEIIEI